MSEKPQLSIVPQFPDNVANADVIAKLEFFLAEAKAGNIVGIALAGYDRARRNIYTIVPGENPTVLLGAVRRGEHRLNSYMDEIGAEVMPTTGGAG